MNENNDKGILYDMNDAVKALNNVDGFEPKNYLREEKTDEGTSVYLDTKFRLLWFRLKYPDGKLVKIPKALNKDYATFEVRVYSHKDDTPDNFLANGFASRYRDDGNEKFGLNFVEIAETAALGRALKDAGFGTQFCDIALPNDQTIVDAGVNISFDCGNDELPKFKRYRSSKHLSKEMVDYFIEKIIVHSNKSIDIRFKFSKEQLLGMEGV